MSTLRNIWARLAAVVAVTLVTVLAPSAAMAAGSPAAMAGELARGKLRVGVGLTGALCCLLAVAAVALIIYLIVRATRRHRH